MRWLVNLCYLLAAVVLVPLLFYKSRRTGKYRRDWGQRRGFLPDLPAHPRRVWFHAVSVGEVNAIQGLVYTWHQREPQTDFVISCTTDTGIDRARKQFGDHTVVRYPIDLSWWIRRGLDRVKPSIIVLVELEVWYNFVTMAAARGIPVCVINGRVTAGKSMKRFRWVMPIVKRMFRSLTWVGAQDETYAARFRQLGVPADRVAVAGSVKWDSAQIAGEIPGDAQMASAMGIDRNRPLWVCGSTGTDEEPLLLEVYRELAGRHPGTQLAIVPRKPERFDEVAGLIRQAGFDCIRRSESPDTQKRPNAPPGKPAVFLVDTMGELRKMYALADVVFVGRTLAPLGGSDMMEVAALARPIVLGPHTDNFADTVRQLRDVDAIACVEADLSNPLAREQLLEKVSGLLSDPRAAAGMGRRGRETVERNRGATERTLNTLTEIMDRAQHRPA